MENGTTSSRLVERCSRHRDAVRREHRALRDLCKVSRASALLTLMCGAAAWAATDAARGVIVVWTGDDQWVRIEQQDDPAASPNDHPASLGAPAVASALGALRIRLVDRDTGTETQRAVFTREEIGNLAPQVASGLAKAGPRQDVTFSTIGSHSLAAGGLLKDPGVNAGRVFYEHGRLNVIFGELQSDYRKKNLYGQRSEDFSPRRQGSRSKATQQKRTLAASPGVEFRSTNDGGIRNDWVAIDTAVAGTQILAAPQPSAAAEPARKTGTSNADLEERLQVLKDLKDKGLISEEAYNSKVQELLSEL